MQIPPEKLKKWEGLRSLGDADKIAKKAKLTGHAIRMTFRTGRCSDNTFKIISQFFDRKAKDLKQYM